MIMIMVRDAMGLSNPSTVKWMSTIPDAQYSIDESCLMLCCTVITWNWLADRDQGLNNNNDHGSP